MKGELERAAPWRDPLAAAILLLMLGIVLIALRSAAVSMVVVIAGAILMVYGAGALSMGIRNDTSGDTVLGLLSCILGILLVVASGMFMVLMVYVLAAVLIVFGVVRIADSKKGRGGTTVNIVIGVVLILVGVVFVLYPGSTVNTAMVVIGVILIAVAGLSIWQYVK